MLGIFASCEDIIEEPDISNQTVFILAPLEGSTINDNRISFNWEAVTDARAYTVQVASPTFADAVQLALDSTLVRDTLGFLSTNIQQTLFNGNYEWRVRAENAGFSTLYSIASFTVSGEEDLDLIAPNTPTLVSPADMSAQDETEVTFTWNREAISGSAERDSIYIYTDQTLDILELKGLGANKSFTTSLNSNTYYWFVQAFDAAGNSSPPSTVFELTIN